MLIDAKLVELANQYKKTIKKLKEEDSRPSALLLAKEEFFDQWKEIIKTAFDNISDAEKITAFNSLIPHVLEIVSDPETYLRDGGDREQYIYEDVLQKFLGKNIFTALNTLHHR